MMLFNCLAFNIDNKKMIKVLKAINHDYKTRIIVMILV